MATRRRPPSRSNREKRPRRRQGGGAWRWVVGLLLLTAGGWVVWQWGPWRGPSARPLPPRPAESNPVPDISLEEPLIPPVTNEPPETPRVRISTNLVRVLPEPATNRPAVATNVATPVVRSPETNGLDRGNAETFPVEPRPVPEGRPVRDAFEAQLALLRMGIASGPLDGALGSQTRAAVQIFQRNEGLPTTGLLDSATRERLRLQGESFAYIVVTQQDLDHLAPIPGTWLGKSQVERLGYETALEMVSEMSHSHPALLRKLNPGVDWTRVSPGTSIKVPRAEYPTPQSKAALVRISLAGRNLRAYDNDGVLLCFFPCSIAQRVDKRPVGDLRVEVVIKDPDYTFNPDVFPESAEARELKRKLRLPPGPNNPVGVAWIGLSRPGYGIHGTPKPEDVGRTESHGCFRLANWNADYLRQLVSVGTPVVVEP